MEKRFSIAGFTLAEVLITLTIIGVIAALTIPSLITNIQDAQFKTAWKKEYSILEQASRLVIADNGSLDTFFTSSDNLRNAFLSKMIFVKTQDYNLSDDNTWHAANKWYDMSGVPQDAEYGSNIIMPDGTWILFHINWAVVSAGGVCAPGNNCGYIYVDVNGLRGPNVIGKDIYGIKFFSNFISPYGSDKTGYRGSCVPTDSGWACSTLYLRQ